MRGDVAHLVGVARDGALVAEVAAGRGVGQEQVVAHDPGEVVGAGGVDADAGGDLTGDRLPHHRVVARSTLGDVVEERAEEQQIAARGAGGDAVEAGAGGVVGIEQRGALGHRLERVPVDGEAVVRVALRPGAHRRPLGQEALPARPRDRATRTPGSCRARPEQVDERVARRRDPTRTSVHSARRSSVARSNGARGPRRVHRGA